jgi:hypothetical protein
MLDSSFFVSGGVQSREIKLADGKSHKLYFKEYSGAAFTQYAIAVRSEKIEERAVGMPILIAASLCEADGSPAITFERACELKPEVMQAIFAKVMEVNGVQKDGEGEKNA